MSKEETVAKRAPAKKAKPKDDGIDMDRIAAIERALGATVGINVNDFNPREVQAAREQALADAEAKSKAILAEAEKFEVVLTPQQRLERLERAARSAGVAI